MNPSITLRQNIDLVCRNLRGKDKSLTQHAFDLSKSALAEEPNEWPTQLIARLRGQSSAKIRNLLHSLNQHAGDWLQPIAAPLLPAGSPIRKILNVGTPFDSSAALMLSQDLKTITAFSRTAVHVWDMESEREIGRVDLNINYARAAIADPPHFALVAPSQQKLLLVNLLTPSAELIFAGETIESVAIAADSSRAVITTVPADWDYLEHDWNGPRTFRLFDLPARTCIRTWQAHQAYVTDLALSHNGRFLATASRDCTSQFLDLENSKLIGAWRCADKVVAVAISPSGHRMAYVSEGGALTVRKRDGKLLRRFANVWAYQTCLAMSANGHRIIAASDGDVQVIDLRQPKPRKRIAGTQPYLSSLATEPSARYALTGEQGTQLVLWDLRKASNDQPCRKWFSGIWAADSSALIHQEGAAFIEVCSGNRDELFSANDFGLAAAPGAGLWAVFKPSKREGGQIRLGKWGRRASTQFLSGPEYSQAFPFTMHFSRNGGRLAIPIHRTGCRVVEVTTGATVWENQNLGLGVRPFLSPSGSFLALASLAGQLQLVDLEAQTTVQTMDLQPLTEKLFFLDDSLIVLSQNLEVMLLHWRTAKTIRLCAGSPSSLSDDAKWLLTEFNSRKLTLWQVQDHRRVATYTLDVPVVETALSSDGSLLFAGDQNGALHILRNRASGAS